MAKQVFSKEERHAQAVKIGMGMAKQVGLARVSIGKVAAKLQVTAPLLFHVFGSRDGFHKAVAKAAKAAGVVFPEAQPTVRAERAARRVEREKTVKTLSKGAKPKPAVKVTPPKKAKPATVATKVKAKPAVKVAPPKPAAKKGKSANASIAKAKAADKRAKASGKVRVPKVVPPELAKFPAMPVPTVAAPVTAAA
jgi:hypothetical protein